MIAARLPTLEPYISPAVCTPTLGTAQLVLFSSALVNAPTVVGGLLGESRSRYALTSASHLCGMASSGFGNESGLSFKDSSIQLTYECLPISAASSSVNS